MRIIYKLWIYIAILVILSPIGLILPELFKAGPAWGEWAAEETEKLIGYIPQGLEKLAGLWPAPIPGYAFKSWVGKGFGVLGLSYVISAIAGIGITLLVTIGIGKFLARKGD